ncbi:MAG TPA: polysaccharide deacetylase family protein [Polyangia bacterium]|nr:polysaccharide deacetylase family protein [Polyangia bacterium]
MRRVCSVSIDLDPLRCYYEIHGLGAPPAGLRHVVLRRALPRFAELLAAHDVRATFFVVGQDLAEDEAGRTLLGELAAAGHELGNHSEHHLYDLGRQGREAVRTEIERAHERIARVAGHPPVGFRAPGYDLSPAMAEALMTLGYNYDSSIFPAPLYWAAKAAVMGVMAMGGRRSGAVMANPRALAAPLLPYRLEARAPWRRGQAPLVELPVAVSPRLRIPVIGTTVLGAPMGVRTRLLESMRERPFFNFELHGIDLIDADDDGIPAELVARQPDLRVPLVEKRRALASTLEGLAPDFRFAPLREVASEVQLHGRM